MTDKEMWMLDIDGGDTDKDTNKGKQYGNEKNFNDQERQREN